MDIISNKFNSICSTPSDINEHLGTLFLYATNCDSILECGVRGCVSSWALTYGLLMSSVTREGETKVDTDSDTIPPLKSVKRLTLNDIEPCNVKMLLALTKNLNINIDCQWKSDLEIEVTENYDMVFIDTFHVYGQLKRELDKFSKVTNKYIIMHDTTIDEYYGELRRQYTNKKEYMYKIHEYSRKLSMSVEEVELGLGKAITDFLSNNPEWYLLEKYTNNNGLTILSKRS